jgi:hypothetical protein
MNKGLKHIILLVLNTLLLLAALHSYAQIPPVNTGDDPYIGTTHRYQVTADNLSNSRAWYITDETLTTTIVPTPGILVITPGTGNIFYADVTFTSPPFSVGTWVLTYVETSILTGTCVATREFVIHLRENNFYELVYNQTTENPGTSFSECHDSTGTVQDWNNIFNTPFQTAIHFPVYMNKEADFDLNTWEFDASVSVVSAGYSVISIGKGALVSSRGANYTVTLISGSTYRIVVDSPPIGETDDFVDIAVIVSGPMYDNVDVTLNITNGIARSGTSREIITNDNISVYPTDGTYTKSAWRTKTVSTLGIPATQNILPGAGETATSAANPLQNSTHRYTVVIGNIANYNSGNNWSIFNVATSSVQIGGFTLTPTASATADTATIRFTDTMPTGDYILYYTETGSNGCIARRAYPFTLQGPFDADLASISPTCPTASNQIFATNSPSDTEVNYTVTLNNTGYGSAWSFNFNLSSSPVFNVANVSVSGTTVTPITVSYDSGTGLVSVPADVEEVTLTVTYNGIYETAHTITATLTNVTGSYNETDSDTDAISHTIHALPQAGAIAGIE